MPANQRVWWWSAKGYWVIQINGKRLTLAKGKSNKKVAQEKLDRLMAERELLSTVGGPISVAALCEEFLEDAHENLAESTYKSYRNACQLLCDELGDREAHSIKPSDFRRFIRTLRKRMNETTQGIVLRSLLRCFNWGVAEELIPSHSLGKIRKPTGVRRDRFLSDDEFRQLMRATNTARHGAEFRRLLLAMDWTMCRPGELCRLEWKDIRWEQKIAVLEKHKTRRATGRAKVVPLVPKMIRLLRWLEHRSRSDTVFVNANGNAWNVQSISQRMRKVRKRAGLGKDVIPYTIRHRAATNAILRTGDLKLTSLLLGHTSTTTTERYTHVAQDHLVAFAEKVVG